MTNPQDIERARVGLLDRLTALHEAARGCEFDLTPSDGPIAQLALFMHESGDALISALSTPAPKISEEVRAWLFENARPSSAVAGQRLNITVTIGYAGSVVADLYIGHVPIKISKENLRLALATEATTINNRLSDIDGEGAQGAETAEGHCEQCESRYHPWFAPSPLWNAVMRGGSINGPWKGSELICANCFMENAESAGIASDWKIVARRVRVSLETVTPSGRVWDDRVDLWVEPASYTPKPTPQPAIAEGMVLVPTSEAAIKHMVDRFLSWKLPADFHPDGGISLINVFGQPWPLGTNLLTAAQADEMVRHMLSGLLSAAPAPGTSEGATPPT